jgi:hypothetical protein
VHCLWLQQPFRNTGLRVLRNIHIAGWVVFILSAFAFIASSLRSGDILGLLGGILFLIACFVFLVPLLISRS